MPSWLAGGGVVLLERDSSRAIRVTIEPPPLRTQNSLAASSSLLRSMEFHLAWSPDGIW